MNRARLFTFGAAIAATAVLAVLGYVSLRQWQASAELLFREQAREMATMAAEKIEIAILKTEEECLSSLQPILMDPAFRPESLHILRLRQKFEEDPERPAHILTVHGQGYRFAG